MKNYDRTVFIVDDDEAVRDSLQLLMKSVGLEVKCYSLAAEFLQAYETGQAGCLVLDIRMPGMSGLALQQELLKLHASIPIIFITGHGDVPMAVQAIRDGALDFIQKPFRDQDLIDRIHAALEMDAQIRAKLHKLDSIGRNLDTLTKRERQILDMIVDGKPNKVIAAKLFLSQRTVEVHRARAMEKMEADSTADLVRMVTLFRSR